MTIARDTQETLRCAITLVNSAEFPDALINHEQLQRALSAHGYIWRLEGSDEELDDVRASRRILKLLLTGSGDDLAYLINKILREAKATPQLVQHEGFGWHILGVAGGAPVVARVLVQTALAMTVLLCTHQLDRLKACGAQDCARLMLDTTKGKSRVFCSRTCGNRMASSAYRKRQRPALPESAINESA